MAEGFTRQQVTCNHRQSQCTDLCEEPKKKYIFTLVVWLIVFVIAETGVRLSYWASGKVPPTPDPSLRDEWKWAKEHLQAGTPILKSNKAYDPHTGWRNKPNVDTDSLRTNSRGMRSDKEFSEDPGSRKRILFVGDSYTFGHGATNEQSYPYVLGARYLPDWDVLNMAVGGTGTDQQLIDFEQYGRHYQPDVVVLGFYVRDYYRNLLSFRGFAKPLFALDGEGIRLSNHPVISPRELYDEYASDRRALGSRFRPYLSDIFLKVIRERHDRSISETALGWKVLCGIMERFNAKVKETGAIPIWLIIPSRDIMTSEHSHFETLETLCEKKSSQLGMLCLRLDGPLREFQGANPDREVYRDRSTTGGHLSPGGLELTAKLLYEFMSGQNLID